VCAAEGEAPRPVSYVRVEGTAGLMF
jgi:hypothetical protein